VANFLCFSQHVQYMTTKLAYVSDFQGKLWVFIISVLFNTHIVGVRWFKNVDRPSDNNCTVSLLAHIIVSYLIFVLVNLEREFSAKEMLGLIPSKTDMNATLFANILVSNHYRNHQKNFSSLSQT
jgi:hypothetical protein